MPFPSKRRRASLESPGVIVDEQELSSAGILNFLCGVVEHLFTLHVSPLDSRRFASPIHPQNRWVTCAKNRLSLTRTLQVDVKHSRRLSSWMRLLEI
jgi:hypothetical protein